MADVDRRQDTNYHKPEEDTVTEVAQAVPAWMVGENAAALSLSGSVYSRKAVLAAAYKLSDRCALLVDTDGEERWVVFLVAPPGGQVGPLLALLIRELTDQALRDRLEEEFGAIRTLIVAQAFSEGNLLDPNRDDADPSRDPYGTERRR